MAKVKEKFSGIFKKKPEKWTTEEAFKYRDQAIMNVAAANDNYAEMLSDEVYDRLVTYIENKMFDMNRPIPVENIFRKRINEAKVRAAANKKVDDDTPKEEEKKDKDSKKEEEEKREREENEKVIDIVGKINEKEKAKQQANSSNEKESKPKEEVKEEKIEQPKAEKQEDVTVKQDSADDMISGIAKGIKYINLFDKMRDDMKDLYDTVAAKEELKDIVNEYNSSISNCINNILEADKDTLTTVVKSDKRLAKSLDSILSVSDIANKSQDENKDDVIRKSIVSIFIAPEVNSFLKSVIKETKKDPDSDEVLSAAKDKMVEFKNQVTKTPEVVKDKLISFISTLVDFNNSIVTASESKYESKFIPKEEKKKEDGILFGDDWKTEAIHFDFDKMNIPLNPKSTKKSTKETQNIISQLEPIIDKNKYQFKLELLLNGTYEFKLIESNGNVHRFIIDAGVVIGHGLFIFADNNYISFEEKDIITRLLNNPATFKLSEEEINKCRSYLFKQDWLYNYIDMKGGKANKISRLSQEQYYTLGNNLEKIIYEFCNKYGVYCRFRFKEFTNENTFVLASDKYTTDIIGSNIPIAPLLTEIIYKDNKVIVNYGDQTNSFNL